MYACSIPFYCIHKVMKNSVEYTIANVFKTTMY